MNISGIKLNVMQEVKPLLDRTVNEQMAKAAGATAQRSDPGADRTARVGQVVPLDLTRARRPEHAGAVARGEADPGGRRATQDRSELADRDRRRARRDAHHAERDQAELSVPGAIADRAADGSGQGRDRGADRSALHRAQPHSRSAAQGQDVPGGSGRRGAGHGAEGDARRLRRQAADLAQGQGEGEEELVRARRRRRRVRLGQAHARQQAADPALHRHDARRRFRRRRSASPAPWRTSRSPICRNRWPTRP